MAINGIPATGGPYEGGVVHNGMQQLVRNKSPSTSSLVSMVGSRCGGTPHMGLQGPQSSGHGHGGLEVAVIGLQGGSGQKRPYWDGGLHGLTVEDGEEGDEDCSPQLEKKRRLTFDQVRALEENFEMENKLEPERKMQLAKDLGLRPRQVAVWFQNRRARWKTKQLERDYELLAQDYKCLQSDYEKLITEKTNLRAELQRLTKASLAVSSPKVDVKDNTETSGSSNSSDVVDAESPRTTVDSSSNLSPSSNHRDQEERFHPSSPGFHPSSPEFPPESCFMVPNIDDAAVKLEDDDSPATGGFNDVDPSYSYLLPQLYDQSGVLPWWD